MATSTSMAAIAAEAIHAGEAGYPTLATERLPLRPVAPGDAENLHRLLNDWEVCRTLQTVPFPYPQQVARDWLASTIIDRREGRAFHLAITGQEEGRELLVGAVGLKLVPKTRRATLGY